MENLGRENIHSSLDSLDCNGSHEFKEDIFAVADLLYF